MSEVDPGSPEGVRRTRRGVRLGLAAALALAAQGGFLLEAVRTAEVVAWITWAAVLAGLVVVFAIEHRIERRRRPNSTSTRRR